MSGIKLGSYQHFKGGLYTVIGVAQHSEDETQEFVVYKNQKTDQLWIRPLQMFLEEVDRDGYKGPRFKFLE
jgi:hypothetical protein